MDADQPLERAVADLAHERDPLLGVRARVARTALVAQDPAEIAERLALGPAVAEVAVDRERLLEQRLRLSDATGVPQRAGGDPPDARALVPGQLGQRPTRPSTGLSSPGRDQPSAGR